MKISIGSLALFVTVAFAAIPMPPPTPIANQQMKPRATMRMGRRIHPQLLMKKKETDVAHVLCPPETVACPIIEGGEVPKLETLSDWFSVGFECVDEFGITSCGGCPALKRGQNCSLIPNALKTSCTVEGCQIVSCREGSVHNAETKSCDTIPGNADPTLAGSRDMSRTFAPGRVLPGNSKRV
ncbi:hypothetical protein FRC02_010999 [Tulasnella sp. 418]|nr:hypothetical protein FRC02_010999 [Tulasnella sp. 418]